MMNNAYDIVMSNRKELVESLIAQMEKGYAATREAWNKSGTRPYNPVSDAVYKGGNRLRLMIAAAENDYKDPRWLTFKQAAEKHYKINPGSKGVLLEKWIFHKDVPKLDENGKPVLDTNGKPETERELLKKPVVNYFRVFNGEQVTGLPELEHKEITEDIFTEMTDRFERSSLCPIHYEYQDRAYYSVTEDKIHLPPKEAFKNNETRLSVLLHEMSHSTGHPDRLNRSILNKFGSPDYAREELNAELSSAFLESELGITMEPDSEMIKDHSNYLKSWISVLREDPNELFRACANAEKITEFLMEHYEKEPELELQNSEGIESMNWIKKEKSLLDAFIQRDTEDICKLLPERKELAEKIVNFLENYDSDFEYTKGIPGKENKEQWIETIKEDLTNDTVGLSEYIKEFEEVSLHAQEEAKIIVAELRKCLVYEEILSDISIYQENAGVPQEERLISSEASNKQIIDQYKKALPWIYDYDRGWECDYRGKLINIDEYNARIIAQYEEETSVPEENRIISRNNNSYTFSENVTREKYYSVREEAFCYDDRCMELQNSEEVSRDISGSGFRATETLVDNIRKFSRMEGKNYTLKELAELNRSKPDFKDNPQKKECFEQIIKECQEQEMENQIGTAKEAGSFFKQEMLMEQSLMMGT